MRIEIDDVSRPQVLAFLDEPGSHAASVGGAW
jgi:hypothetical protein